MYEYDVTEIYVRNEIRIAVVLKNNMKSREIDSFFPFCRGRQKNFNENRLKGNNDLFLKGLGGVRGEVGKRL